MPEPVASADSVVVPARVAAFDGISTLVERFATVIGTPALVALLPVLSTARDVKVYAPSLTVVLFHLRSQPHLLLFTVPINAFDRLPPVRWNSTVLIGALLVADADRLYVPDSVVLDDGFATLVVTMVFTVCVITGDSDGANVASPVYAAVIECWPYVSAEVATLAWPALFSVCGDPRLAPLSLN